MELCVEEVIWSSTEHRQAFADNVTKVTYSRKAFFLEEACFK